VGIGIIISVAGNGPLGVDRELQAALRGEPDGFWVGFSLVLNFLGGGWFGSYLVPALVVAVLCLFRRWWSALFAAVALSLSAGVVQWLKVALDRPRPDGGLIQFGSDAFPSGHVGNTATLAVVVGVILMRSWVWAVGVACTIAMAASRLILGVHWFSDTVGAVLVGAGITVLVLAACVSRVRGEIGAEGPLRRKAPLQTKAQ
jgi:undecaprenyl-diphosphatase